MVNFNNKYTILVIVLVALALLFAVWGIYKHFKKNSSSINSYDRYPTLDDAGIVIGGRKRRHTKKKVNKK